MKTALTILLLLFMYKGNTQLVSSVATNINLANTSIYVDESDEVLVQKSAELLKQDIFNVTGKKPDIIHRILSPKKSVIIIGSLEKSSWIKQLVQAKKINPLTIMNKWEAYQILSLQKPFNEVGNALVIVGNDRRGTAFGIFELSRQMGVSPWYWWADVPVKKKANVYINNTINIVDSPKVKYRGIFINDEAPALSGWTKEKFGGFNHQFYEKVFELILRLKGNYLWPAMWGNAFNADDTLNPILADEYGIVMGTSHHEPMLRAQQEWKKFGKGAWDYTKNDTVLKAFWKKGIENMQHHESILTVGMRGDGDMPMTKGTATELLEKIVGDQRNIIEEVTKKPPSQTPQLWALYKEVQDYYDKGMRVPDDVTLLLCDDNWGHIRKLPRLNEKQRTGGYGIYYHFDYVGGPRNYKWLNTNPLPRIWEQMHLAWEYNARQIWVVNVGDIKPMEVPISFFLDYAWNPEKLDAKDVPNYTTQWAAAQFGKAHASEIADILAKYAKYNGRRKPELLDAATYSFNYNEWDNVVKDYNSLLKKAETIGNLLPAAYKDAYFQLVLHPVKACANLNEMYYNVALNKRAYANKWSSANAYADKVKLLYGKDSLITQEYHQLNNGKWNHMMSQKHIGYRMWQEPRLQTMPEVKYVPVDSATIETDTTGIFTKAVYPTASNHSLFFEQNNYVSIEANHFTKAINANGITWKLLSDLGRTGSAITPFPVTANVQQPTGNAPHLEYEVYTYSDGPCTINGYFSPSLNFANTEEGLQYAISIDDEAPQIISINKEDKTSDRGIWNKWVSEGIIIKSSKHTILKAGKHTIKYWMVTPAVVLEKLVLDFGGAKPSFLGPPETINNQKK